MSKLRKASYICLLASSIASFSTYALTPQKGWFAELEGFYAQPNDTLLNGLPYAFTDTDVGELGPAAEDYHHINFDKGWSGRIAVGYDACFNPQSCSTTGFSLEYTWFDRKNDQRLFSIASPTDAEIDDNSFLSGIFFTADPPDYSNADVNNKVEYHALDFLGHKKMGYCGANLDVFAGVRYVKIEEDLHAHYYVDPDLDIPPTSFIDECIHYDVDFQAIGPRLGGKVYYPLFNSCFGIAGELGGSLLFSKTDADYYDHFFDPDSGIYGGPKEITFRNSPKDTYHVVPAISGKIALAANGTWCSNCNHYSLTVEAGFRGDRYFNAIDHNALIQSAGYEVPFSESSDDGIQDSTRSRMYTEDTRYHAFDVLGPYISVTFHA